MLKRSMVVGVRAGAAERHLEGSVWLLLVTSEAFAVPENLVHATAEYEVGYLVVRGFALEQRSPRGYTLLTEEVLVVVVIVLLGLELFSAVGQVEPGPATHSQRSPEMKCLTRLHPEH